MSKIKSDMGKKIKTKRLTLLSAIVSFISFGYKFGMGVYTMSIILMIASVSTLMVFICKLLFVKNYTLTRDKKRKGYLGMAIASLIYAVIFLLFVVLKVNGIDISNKNTYEGIIGILLISFTFIMFVLSVIGLKGALEKSDIMVTGLKEITFISALADLVIIEEFVYRTVMNYQDISFLEPLNNYFPLGVSVLMLLVSMFMFIRFARYKE